MCGAELLACQGFPLAVALESNKQGFKNTELVDLAGNAFSASALIAALTIGFVLAKVARFTSLRGAEQCSCERPVCLPGWSQAM